MSAFRGEYTLSIIDEATEQSESEWRDSRLEPMLFAPNSQRAESMINTAQPNVYRGSIFSSETSYGEIIPPGQSSLSQGLLFTSYEKSLPSLPRGSVAQSAASALSAKSNAKTDSPRHSIVKSEFSIHSAAERELEQEISVQTEVETSRRVTTPTRLLQHNSPKMSGKSTPKSTSHRSPVISEPVIPTPPSSSRKVSSKKSVSKSSTVSSETLTASSTTLSKSTPHRSPRTTSTNRTESTSVSSVSTQSTLRTFDDIVEEVATSLALRTKTNAITVPAVDSTSMSTKIGVCATMTRTDDSHFLVILSEKIHHAMSLHSSYLFALIPSVVGPGNATTLVFCGSPQRLVTKASILAGLRFKTRLAELEDREGTWVGSLEGPEDEDAFTPFQDEDLLWDIVRKATSPINPAEPPPGSRGIEQILFEARAKLDRLTPREAFQEAHGEGILVDIRPVAQRRQHGDIPGAIIIDRSELEWRFDPRSVDRRLPIADRYDLRVIVYCEDGFTSSLAAASLQNIGLWRATDIIGGFSRWQEDGLPTVFISDMGSGNGL